MAPRHDKTNINNQGIGDADAQINNLHNENFTSGSDDGEMLDGDKGESFAHQLNIGIAEPPAPARRRVNEFGAGSHNQNTSRNQTNHAHDSTDFIIEGGTCIEGSSKIEAPTSQNIAYLNSLAQRTDADLERKLPPITAIIQETSRGRERYRKTVADSDGFVPLRFVHVPNNRNAPSLDATKRAPSVPDLISYLHNHRYEEDDIPLLSNETLRDKERESRKEQFEERLRMAHLRLNSDAASSATRYRSKSTPSRGGMWTNGGNSGIGNTNIIDKQSCRINGTLNDETNLIGVNLSPFETADAAPNGFHTLSSIQPQDNGFIPSSSPAIIATDDITPGQHDSSANNAANAVGTPNSILVNSSVESSDGSRCARIISGVYLEDHTVLEPPPPRPPATEKERLVERERQARLETERAKRRHIALLRERQLEESGGMVENEGSDDARLIGQVSFDAMLQPAPEFVGDNEMVLDLPAGNSSDVSSSSSIRRPPLPPPPATERERLVERERQARLETERARRRHSALLRERQLEERCDADENGIGNARLLGQVSFDAMLQPAPEFVGDNELVLNLPAGHSSVASSASSRRPPLPPPPATERERLVERERQARLETERARRRHLAVQRERQLDDDNHNVLGEMVHNDVDRHSLGREVNYDGSSLPETPLNGVVNTLLNTAEGDGEGDRSVTSVSSVEYRNQQEIHNTDSEAISYPMERFLERVDDEGPSVLPLDAPSTADNDAAILPYTMELFLAENAPATLNERNLESSGGNDINDTHTQRENDDIIEQPVASPAIQPSLDHDTNLNATAASPIGWTGAVNDLDPLTGSIASTIGSNDQGSMNDNDDSQINVDNHLPLTGSGLSNDFHAENSSRISMAPSHDSFDSNPHLPRLTEAEIAQLAEVERASIGNAAPQSVRDDPSEPSVIGRGDHAFSVATQTTVIESVTEASEGPVESAFSDINESVESLTVIRVGSRVSIQSSSSGDASSASIEAMPSRASGDSNDSNASNHVHSEGIGDSLSHSMASSSHLSSDEIMPRLTAADIVSMAEIDYASIGNAPPRSVRDERLSESSITERLTRQFSITTPIDEISSTGEQAGGHLLMAENSGDHNSLSDHPENSSVEAMPSHHSGHNSDHSIEAMPSEHERMLDSDEEDIVYQASDMGSSASIEALPSIDLDVDAGLSHYGAINARNALRRPSAGEFGMDIDGDYEQDIESAPLILMRLEGQAQHFPNPQNSNPDDCCDEREKRRPHKHLIYIAPLLVVALAELPTFVIIGQGSERLSSLLGVGKYLIACLTIFYHFCLGIFLWWRITNQENGVFSVIV